MVKKLLYDIEEIILSRGNGTGIVRVSSEIMKELSKRKEYKIYPLVTSKKIHLAHTVLNQIGLSKLIPNIVYMPHLRKTCPEYKLTRRIRAFIFSLFITKKYKRLLPNFDEYISIYAPISPIVYKSKIRTKIFLHDLIPILFPKMFRKKTGEKFAYKVNRIKSDEIICVSNSTQSDFLKFRNGSYPANQTKVAYLAADSRFKPTPDKNIKDKYNIKTENYFLAVSDHNPRKNFPHLMSAFIEYITVKKIKDLSLVIVGPKHDFELVEDAYQKIDNQLKDRIILTGFVPDEDLPKLYTEAELFIYPSLYEGFGLPVLEAMQCGTPVLTCNNSSLPEVGGNAVEYISGQDIQETIRAMDHLHQDKLKRDKMSKEGLIRSKQFSWERTVNCIFDLTSPQKGKQ